jgi:hypothetical protein
MSKKLDPGARILWGVTIDKSMKQTVRVMLIVTGLREKEDEGPKRIEESLGEKIPGADETDNAFPFGSGHSVPDATKSIFDIKESIMAAGEETTTLTRSKKVVAQTSLIFYKIFEEEAANDLRAFDRAIHRLRENADNRRAVAEALQACKLLHASSQMFGFDEIGQLLNGIEEILQCVQSKEIQMTQRILDSVTLAMEMVVDLLENRSDGRGETGYLVDRLRDLKSEQLDATPPSDEIPV